MAEELEHAPHHDALKIGKIIFGDPQEHRACLVRHITGTCAVVEVMPDTSTPDEFRLVSAGLAFDQFCRVSWRNGQKVGVNFAR